MMWYFLSYWTCLVFSKILFGILGLEVPTHTHTSRKQNKTFSARAVSDNLRHQLWLPPWDHPLSSWWKTCGIPRYVTVGKTHAEELELFFSWLPGLSRLCSSADHLDPATQSSRTFKGLHNCHNLFYYLGSELKDTLGNVLATCLYLCYWLMITEVKLSVWPLKTVSRHCPALFQHCVQTPVLHFVIAPLMVDCWKAWTIIVCLWLTGSPLV